MALAKFCCLAELEERRFEACAHWAPAGREVVGYALSGEGVARVIDRSAIGEKERRQAGGAGSSAQRGHAVAAGGEERAQRRAQRETEDPHLACTG